MSTVVTKPEAQFAEVGLPPDDQLSLHSVVDKSEALKQLQAAAARHEAIPGPSTVQELIKAGTEEGMDTQLTLSEIDPDAGLWLPLDQVSVTVDEDAAPCMHTLAEQFLDLSKDIGLIDLAAPLSAMAAAVVAVGALLTIRLMKRKHQAHGLKHSKWVDEQDCAALA